MKCGLFGACRAKRMESCVDGCATDCCGGGAGAPTEAAPQVEGAVTPEPAPAAE